MGIIPIWGLSWRLYRVLFFPCKIFLFISSGGQEEMLTNIPDQLLIFTEVLPGARPSMYQFPSISSLQLSINVRPLKSSFPCAALSIWLPGCLSSCAFLPLTDEIRKQSPPVFPLAEEELADKLSQRIRLTQEQDFQCTQVKYTGKQSIHSLNRGKKG